MKSVGTRAALEPKWYTAAQVAQLFGYGKTNGWMLIISGDRRSLKDERARGVLPEWVEDYVRLGASRAEDTWRGRRLDVRAVKDSLSLPAWVTSLCVGYHEQRPSAAQVRHRLLPSGKANTPIQSGERPGPGR